MEFITIRQLATIEEFHEFERVERAIWGMPDVEVIPTHVLLTVAKNGGLVLGAFDGGDMVGVLCGFLGRDTLGWKHCSHVMGVLAEQRGRGIGSALKWAQREAVLGQGLDRVTWTYDPLGTPNARLNLHALGAVCRRYLPDLYGPLADELNAGLPTDRFEVDWWLATPEVEARRDGRHPIPEALPAPANRVALYEGTPWPRPEAWDIPVERDISVAIPGNFAALRRADPALALAWRLHTREAFTALFAAGYVAYDFVVEADGRCARYLLRK
ncbi:MAG TPA: GNAT family N-acetyltransferase [Ardenticatenaceae bacterium]|nr:GNAT family N-acetyltransferase [Ardenticatenaceae bacterium]